MRHSKLPTMKPVKTIEFTGVMLFVGKVSEVKSNKILFPNLVTVALLEHVEEFLQRERKRGEREENPRCCTYSTTCMVHVQYIDILRLLQLFSFY